MFCTNCGHKNPDGANFCSSCGSALSEGSEQPSSTITFMAPEMEAELDEEIHVSPEELEGGRGVLIVKRGPNAGSKFFLDTDVTQVGRHPDSDIFLDDITVSRRHAELLRQGPGYVLRDTGSLNGTYINRERIEEASLSTGDEVQIGKFKLVFVTAPGEG